MFIYIRNDDFEVEKSLSFPRANNFEGAAPRRPTEKGGERKRWRSDSPKNAPPCSVPRRRPPPLHVGPMPVYPPFLSYIILIQFNQCIIPCIFSGLCKKAVEEE